MRTLLLGLDAFDPGIFERLSAAGSLPNLTRFVDQGYYAHLEVANPPQSEVSWTSIATGLNPGGHGIFDFVHRNPKNYAPFVSLLPTKQGLGGSQFVPPFNAHTLFDQAIRRGYPASVMWWPAMFPARLGSPVNSLPGLGTPDIHGKLGVGVFFTSEAGFVDQGLKTPVERLAKTGTGRFDGTLKGPIRKSRWNVQETGLPMQVELLDDRAARVRLGDHSLELTVGEWSPILELTFKVGFLVKIRALTRLVITQLRPELRLYTLPLQLHPLQSIWPYGTPGSFVKRAWEAGGPFLTIGWPQDTTGLEEGLIDDRQFLDLCDAIFDTRVKILMDQLAGFREGVIGVVFDTLDRIQHMFWHDRQEVIEGWYEKLDALVGRVAEKMGEQGTERTRVLVVSDHGFNRFDTKVHLNRWLIEQGYLTPHDETPAADLHYVDWSQSRAYALGLNSIYLNLAGREGQGTVEIDQADAVRQQITAGLESWLGSDGKPVVEKVYRREETFAGSLIEYAPDLLIGFAPGYRASAQTGLGRWEPVNLEPNNDHWSGDHCFHAAAVPGVLFSNQRLGELGKPSYRDIPRLAIGEDLEDSGSAPPPGGGDEDQEVVEERLRSLGYL